MDANVQTILHTAPDASIVALARFLTGGNVEEWVIRDQLRRLREAAAETDTIRVPYLRIVA